MKNLDLNDLYLFVQVVDAGSFSAASRQLDMPKATISRRIAKLEEQLGVALFQRNTHQFEITYLGQQYYSYCLQLVVQAKRAEQFIAQQNHSKGRVKFSCPRELLDLYVNKMLIEFMELYPEVDLVVESTYRAVDLIQEQFDFALRIRPWPMPDSDEVVRTFCFSPHLLVASPTLVTEPIDPCELHQYPSLTWQAQQKQSYFWHLQHSPQGQKSIQHTPKLISENLNLIREATLASKGIAMLPEVLVREDINQGTLRKVLPEGWVEEKWMVHAAYASRKCLTLPAKSLLDFLSNRFASSDYAL